MSKKNKVKFWVQSGRMNNPIEAIKLLPVEWEDSTIKSEVEEWAEDVFPMFHFTEAIVRYGFEILEEVEIIEFRLSLTHFGENHYNEKLIWIEFSIEEKLEWEGSASVDNKLKKLLDLFPKTMFTHMEIFKDKFGYALSGEITKELFFKIQEILET